MNSIFKKWLIILISILFFTCTKEIQTDPIIDTEWEVWSITAPDRIFILISPTPYHINFQKDNIYTMRLDVNSCGSTYTLENESNIYIDPIYCTEICCDKAYADTLIRILKDVNSYKITGEDLKLISPTRIINLTQVNND
ncbi:MAG: META domain-containing protein [Bacteroidia bacterium]|nr:META domain-containing protein [Bacteroidia bacterium]